MKLSKTDIDYLIALLNTASVGGVEALIIDEGKARAVNPDRSFAILTSTGVPNFNQKLGLSRLSSLKSRLDLFSGMSTEIEAKETERGEISQLEISSGKSQTKFRCTSTSLIKAPTSLNDKENLVLRFTEDEIKFVLNAIRVMGGKTSSLCLAISKDLAVTIKISTEDSNDSFSTILEIPAEVVGDLLEHQSFFYAPGVFSAALAASKLEREHLHDKSKVAVMVVGLLGTINLIINDHACVVLPKLGDNDE